MRICATCGKQWAASIDRCPIDGAELATPAIATTNGQLAVDIAPVEELAAGSVVGEYTIERRIGEGGMGIVYGARHPVIGKQAAIKVLNARLSADREGVARFIQEAQAVNKIGHANIVDIFSFGTLPDGRAYFVMEWLLGDTLQDRIDRGPMPVADVLAIMSALCKALEAAHAAGVIHRDLKPDNVILVADEDGFRVKLLDFGIAKLQTQKPLASKTATGVTVGTPLYMSPEQARGLDLDGKSDIYSLGVLGYAMVCGRTPFEDEASPVEILHAHLKRTPTPPRAIRSEIPASVEALILALLAKLPEQRPELGEVRRRLAAIATRSAPIAAPDASQLTTDDEIGIARPERRTGLLVAGALGLVVLAGAGAFFALHGGSKDKAPPPAPVVAAAEPAPTPAPPPPPPPPAETPAPAPETGAIDVAIEPASATVTVDGAPSKLEAGHLKAELAPGPHALSVRASGYRTHDEKLDVTAGKPLTLKIRLDRAHGTARPVAHDTDAVVNPFAKKK